MESKHLFNIIKNKKVILSYVYYGFKKAQALAATLASQAKGRLFLLFKTLNIMLISFRYFLLISLRSGSIFVETQNERYEQNYYSWKWL